MTFYHGLRKFLVHLLGLMYHIHACELLLQSVFEISAILFRQKMVIQFGHKESGCFVLHIMHNQIILQHCWFDDKVCNLTLPWLPWSPVIWSLFPGPKSRVLFVWLIFIAIFSADRDDELADVLIQLNHWNISHFPVFTLRF